MIAPDPANRQPCCGCNRPHHWIDCPEWEFYRQGGYWRRRPTVDDLAQRIGERARGKR